MRGRTARYGYRIENGKPVIAEDERAVLEQICAWYRNGISLGNIAEKLNAAGVPYQPGATGWNKARLMRMLEDERYTGADGYPPIWSRETREVLLQCKQKRNTQKQTDRKAGIYCLPVPVVCADCGAKMRRTVNRWQSGGSLWVCTNKACHAVAHPIDTEMMQTVTECLNRAIAAPENIRVDTSTPIHPETVLVAYTPPPAANAEREQHNLFALLSKAYESIPTAPYLGKLIQADFASAKPLSEFSPDLCAKTVQSVLLREGSVSIRLQTGQEVTKEGFV